MGTSLSKAERADMFRNFAGVLTARIHKDQQAVDAQLSAIIQEQADASGGDVKLFRWVAWHVNSSGSRRSRTRS